MGFRSRVEECSSVKKEKENREARNVFHVASVAPWRSTSRIFRRLNDMDDFDSTRECDQILAFII